MALTGSVNSPFNINVSLASAIPSGGTQSVYVYSEDRNVFVTNNALLEFNDTNWNVEQQATLLSAEEGTHTIKLQSSAPYTCELKTATADVTILGGAFSFFQLGTNDFIGDWVVHDNGKIYAVGFINEVRNVLGQASSYNSLTGWGTTLNAAVNFSGVGQPYASSVVSDTSGGYYISGFFDAVNTIQVSDQTNAGIAYVNPEGTTVPLSGFQFLANEGQIRDMVFHNNKLYIYGDFVLDSAVNGTIGHLIVWDHENFTPNATQISPNGAVYDMAVDTAVSSAADLYFAGGFSTIGGGAAAGFACVEESTFLKHPDWTVTTTSGSLLTRSISVVDDYVYIGIGDFGSPTIDVGGGPVSRQSSAAVRVARNWDTGTPANNLTLWDAIVSFTTGILDVIDDPSDPDMVYIMGNWSAVNGLSRFKVAKIKNAVASTGTTSDNVDSWDQGFFLDAVNGNARNMFIIGTELMHPSGIIETTGGGSVVNEWSDLSNANGTTTRNVKEFNGAVVLCGSQTLSDLDVQTRRGGVAFTPATATGQIQLDDFDPLFSSSGNWRARVAKGKDINHIWIANTVLPAAATTQRTVYEYDVTGFGTLTSWDIGVSSSNTVGSMYYDAPRNRLLTFGRSYTISAVTYRMYVAFDEDTAAPSQLLSTSTFFTNTRCPFYVFDNGNRMLLAPNISDTADGTSFSTGSVIDIDLTTDSVDGVILSTDTTENTAVFSDRNYAEEKVFDDIVTNPDIEALEVDEGTNSIYVMGNFTMIAPGNTSDYIERAGLARVDYNSSSVMNFRTDPHLAGMLSYGQGFSSLYSVERWGFTLDRGVVVVHGLQPELDSGDSYPYYIYCFDRYTGDIVTRPEPQPFIEARWESSPKLNSFFGAKFIIPFGGTAFVQDFGFARLPTASPTGETASTLKPVLSIMPKMKPNGIDYVHFAEDNGTYSNAIYPASDSGYHLIRLSSAPAANHTVTITSEDSSKIRFRNTSTGNLTTWTRTFTPGNWDTPEVFQIYGASGNEGVNRFYVETTNGSETVTVTSNELVSFGGTGAYYPDPIQFVSYCGETDCFGDELNGALINDGAGTNDVRGVYVSVSYATDSGIFHNHPWDDMSLTLNTFDPVDLYVGGGQSKTGYSSTNRIDGGDIYFEYEAFGTGTMEVDFDITRDIDGEYMTGGTFFIEIQGAGGISGLSGSGSSSF